jgi:hypothetical protein
VSDPHMQEQQRVWLGTHVVCSNVHVFLLLCCFTEVSKVCGSPAQGGHRVSTTKISPGSKTGALGPDAQGPRPLKNMC